MLSRRPKQLAAATSGNPSEKNAADIFYAYQSTSEALDACFAYPYNSVTGFGGDGEMEMICEFIKEESMHVH